ncbi:hypothetical protein CK203_053402 [Vitis vinifera]|uniref:Uncharacterized protein n=1 Tax=Vitis vinifera TaxID=29760 RepID=A0A438GZP4_VITVI|nr:hypothetical protein CK203_053402 [Vitis vinifera]
MRNSMNVGRDTWKLSMLVLHEATLRNDVWRRLHESGKNEISTNASNAKAVMYTLNEDTDMKAKFTSMARRLEELEVKKIREVQAILETPVQAMLCSICQSFEHLVEECPTMPAVREMFGIKQMLLDNLSPITMLHMETPTIQIGGTINFSWKPRAPQYTQPGQAPQASSLEQAIVNLSKVVGTLLETRNPSMLSLGKNCQFRQKMDGAK